MELMTYRMRGHVGPDDNIQGSHTDIRPKHELEAWRARDPIVHFETQLLDCGHATRENLGAVRDAIVREVEEAHVFARESPRPTEADLEKYVFHT
jgi:pyruvate dehydrogenase E1 component alpha subunit